jgi:hypothetical protein
VRLRCEDDWDGDNLNASSNNAGLKPAATIACCVLCDAIRFVRDELEIELGEQGFEIR